MLAIVELYLVESDNRETLRLIHQKAHLYLATPESQPPNTATLLHLNVRLYINVAWTQHVLFDILHMPLIAD